MNTMYEILGYVYFMDDWFHVDSLWYGPKNVFRAFVKWVWKWIKQNLNIVGLILGSYKGSVPNLIKIC
jgi:hypothetical protein